MSQIEYGANRRASRRRPPKGSTKMQCHRGPLGLGANLALSVLDLSETGISMVVKAEFKAGEEMQITLEGIMHRRPIQKMATVVWCVPTTDDNWVVGAKFQGPVRYADLNDLTRI